MLGDHRRVSLASLAAVVALAVMCLVIGAPGARAAGGGAESELAADTDAARADNGLPSYAYAGDLASVAERQAQRMAADHAIYHNPNLTSEVTGWRSVGENVGAGTDAANVHDGFMASSEHRGNILSSRFTEIGIGTATGDDGWLYVCEVFRLPEAQPAATPAPAAQPAPASTPPPTPAPTAAPVPDEPASAQTISAPVSAPDAATENAPPTSTALGTPVTALVEPQTIAHPVASADTELRPRLTAAVSALPPIPRRTTSVALWVAALLAQGMLVTHMVMYWRRYRIGSGV